MTQDRAVVYVGMEQEQWLAYEVLKYTIQTRASIQVEVIPLYEAVKNAGIQIPQPQHPSNRGRTPFSFQRFAIPACRNFTGRAIYVDSDMQVFGDIADLWNWPLNGYDLVSVQEPAQSKRRPQFSVMVLDCEKLRWDVAKIIEELDQGKFTYESLLYEMGAAKSIGIVVPARWNDLERYSQGETALTHYTDMSKQPWLSTVNPLASVWCTDLLAAIASGKISESLVEAEVRKGWVRPSLLAQVQQKIEHPNDLSRSAQLHDCLTFVPPYRFQSALKGPAMYGKSPSFGARMIRSAYAIVNRMIMR